MRAKMLLPLVALLVLAAVSVALGACGGGGDDQALFERMSAAWTDNDAAAAQEIYADDAVIYWPEGAPMGASTVGIQAISDLVEIYPDDVIYLGEDILTWAPSADDINATSAKYEGARFIAAPASVGRTPWMTLLEVQDGKVVTEWVTYMERY